jgi:hypothetical protein
VFMTIEQIVGVRRTAEKAIEGMPDGELRTTAFGVILSTLLSNWNSESVENPKAHRTLTINGETSFNGRIESLILDGFLSHPRSIGEIQSALAQHGWHYAQSGISTPLIRMVRSRRLRRLQESQAGRKIWKYSLV